ncbi:MAG: hypothetical protein ACKVZJ_04810 [Phycisphaerales bacterium]
MTPTQLVHLCRNIGVAGTLAAGTLGATPRAGAQVVYSQIANDPCGFGFFSSSVARPNRNFKHADDFVIAGGASIERVRWWGQSEGRVALSLANFSAFKVEIFTSNTAGTIPVSLLRSETFTVAATGPTATGRVAFDSGATEFRHEVALGTPFSALAGVRYFLAISATPIVTSGDAWMWQDGRFVNGRSGVFSFTSGAWSTFQDTDSAFELIAVPGPGVPTGVMVGAVWVVRRRR